MLGYLRVHKAELKMREFTRYQSVYCALCKALGRRFGAFQRLGVTYDATFLALFLLSFEEAEEGLLHEACPANPLKKRPIAAPHPLINFAADITAFLIYEHGVDDWRDGQWLRALPQRAIFLSPKREFQKSEPELTEVLGEYLEMFREYEMNEWVKPIPPGRDALLREARIRAIDAARYNGLMLEEILLAGAEKSSNSELKSERYEAVLRIIGRAMGEWVYLMDALEDQEEDVREARFNPFRGLNRESCKEMANELLIEREEEMQRHAALLPYVKDAAIIQNLFTWGLTMERERCLKGERQKAL